MVLSNVKYDRIRPFMVASIATMIAIHLLILKLAIRLAQNWLSDCN